MRFTNKEVRIQVTKNDKEGVAEVIDDGMGIDPKLFPVLFTKFATKSAGGTGLGLFISRGIVEAHGGTMSASNNEEYGSGGASFVFTLPLFAKQPEPEAPPPG